MTRVDVLGVGVSAVTMRSALAEVARWIDAGHSTYVCVTTVHTVMACQSDPELRDIHNRSGLTLPDGMPMVWAAKWAGFSGTSRVAGPDLMPLACEAGIPHGWRHFFLGGREGEPERLAEGLARRFPGLRVAGTHSPPFMPFDEWDNDQIAALVNAASPNIVWVGLGGVKQEKWMAGMVGRLPACVLVGVGAAFDFELGHIIRAPRWMQRGGLEWLHRLASEPRRLAGRYLKLNPRFVWRVLRQPPKPFQCRSG